MTQGLLPFKVRETGPDIMMNAYHTCRIIWFRPSVEKMQGLDGAGSTPHSRRRVWPDLPPPQETVGGSLQPVTGEMGAVENRGPGLPPFVYFTRASVIMELRNLTSTPIS